MENSLRGLLLLSLQFRKRNCVGSGEHWSKGLGYWLHGMNWHYPILIGLLEVELSLGWKLISAEVLLKILNLDVATGSEVAGSQVRRSSGWELLGLGEWGYCLILGVISRGLGGWGTD